MIEFFAQFVHLLRESACLLFGSFTAVEEAYQSPSLQLDLVGIWGLAVVLESSECAGR